MADGTDEPVDVYLSIGSNIAPEENLRLACRGLANEYGELHTSAVYRNAAEGFEGEDFLNMVVGFTTDASPESIVSNLEELHDEAGRVRLENPFSPRTLDLDMLLYGDMVRRRLKLPHHDIEKYGFVLRPLAELAPDLRHPVSGRTMQALWQEFDHDLHPMQKVELPLT